jgi:TPR repeat protein
MRLIPAFASVVLLPALLLTGCATGVDEPTAPEPSPARLQIPELPKLPGQEPAPNPTVDPTVTNNQRLQIPTLPAPDATATSPAPELAEVTQQPITTDTLAAPTANNNPAPSPVPAANPEDNTVAAIPDAQEPAVPQPATKPHHRTDDIGVVTWRAERGHIPSQLLLGKAYATGDGVTRDLDQARLWLELASMQGDRTAQYELGNMYYQGVGVRQDYLNAREWWLESAISGNDEAQQKLGYMYSEGIGVERDFNKAKSWYTKAANLGNAEAQTLLGSLYHEGNRIKPDYTEAVKWYQLAAEQGHPHAQYTLGILHHDGLGTEQDYVKCAAWVEVALANNYPDDLDAARLCRSKLDEQSGAAADALATLWKTRYLPQETTSQ